MKKDFEFVIVWAIIMSGLCLFWATIARWVFK